MPRVSTSAPVRDGRQIAELAALDRRLTELAIALGAEERQYPALIARDVLERGEYPQAFPHLVFAAASLVHPERPQTSLLAPDNLAPPCWCLSPAVCYHVYAEIAAE